MLLCIPLLFLFPFSRLHSWTSQKRCIQLYARPGYREILSLPHKNVRGFEVVILPILCWYHIGQICWFLVAFSKLVAWLWDNEYELHCFSHFSEMLSSMSSCRYVDSSFEYLISTGSGFSVCILVSRNWKMLRLMRWRTEHQEHSAVAMEWNHMLRWSQFSLFVFS